MNVYLKIPIMEHKVGSSKKTEQRQRQKAVELTHREGERESERAREQDNERAREHERATSEFLVLILSQLVARLRYCSSSTRSQT